MKFIVEIVERPGAEPEQARAAHSWIESVLDEQGGLRTSVMDLIDRLVLQRGRMLDVTVERVHD